MAANSSTESRSPRADGSTPAARSTTSAAAGDPAHPARAARNVLRRGAKAAARHENTAARAASAPGGPRRVKATRPDSTLGTGQKTCRGTDPARRTEAYQAAFTEGTP